MCTCSSVEAWYLSVLFVQEVNEANMYADNRVSRSAECSLVSRHTSISIIQVP